MAKVSANRRNHVSSIVDASVRHAPPFHHVRMESAASDESGDLIDHTVALWQKHTKRTLSREDGREIIENITGFFRILSEWDRAERDAQSKTE